MSDELLTAEEVAARLRVHVGTIQRWLRTGQLRGVRLGGRTGYRVMTADLNEFLERRKPAA